MMLREMLYTQSSTSISWVITHNFGNPVLIDAFINSAKAYPDVMTQSADFNTVTLTWLTARTGSARVVTMGSTASMVENPSWVPDQIGLNPYR